MNIRQDDRSLIIRLIDKLEDADEKMDKRVEIIVTKLDELPCKSEDKMINPILRIMSFEITIKTIVRTITVAISTLVGGAGLLFTIIRLLEHVIK